MTYHTTITDTDRLTTLAAACVQREREIFGYQINIDNYLAMLAALPSDDWPPALAQYQATPTERLPATLPAGDVQAVADYAYRDRLRVLLRTEQVEQGKAQRVLDALRSQIPADQYADLVQAAAAAAPG